MATARYSSDSKLNGVFADNRPMRHPKNAVTDKIVTTAHARITDLVMRDVGNCSREIAASNFGQPFSFELTEGIDRANASPSNKRFAFALHELQRERCFSIFCSSDADKTP